MKNKWTGQFDAKARQNSEPKQQDPLDEALDESFPASDPVSMLEPAPKEKQPSRRPPNKD